MDLSHMAEGLTHPENFDEEGNWKPMEMDVEYVRVYQDDSQGETRGLNPPITYETRRKLLKNRVTCNLLPELRCMVKNAGSEANTVAPLVFLPFAVGVPPAKCAYEAPFNHKLGSTSSMALNVGETSANLSRHCSMVLYFKGTMANSDTARKIFQSALANPGGATAAKARCALPSVLT